VGLAALLMVWVAGSVTVTGSTTDVVIVLVYEPGFVTSIE
jgi:hypothetical protein